MNALMKKTITVLLAALFVATVFIGCNAPEAGAVSASVQSLDQQSPAGNVQSLSTEDTVPENTEPEATEPEDAASGAFSLTDFLKSLLPRFLEFFDWWTAQVNKLFVLIEEA